MTFDNTIKALIDLEREMITDEGPIFFPQHVVTDKVPFIYYVSTFWGFLDPDPPLRKQVFSTENKQKIVIFKKHLFPLQVLT